MTTLVHRNILSKQIDNTQRVFCGDFNTAVAVDAASLLESVQWGVACGAAAASLTGTAVGSPELVERLFLETQTEVITHE